MIFQLIDWEETNASTVDCKYGKETHQHKQKLLLLCELSVLTLGIA
uniref:Uncharacterized protein n=1 Tax=Rhizophora mucronata TaxID=61149 RepID=A0A2P2PUK9_RHIMU